MAYDNLVFNQKKKLRELLDIIAVGSRGGQREYEGARNSLIPQEPKKIDNKAAKILQKRMRKK